MCHQGIKPENVFFITGMSDRSWIDQLKERVLPCWEDNVYHRNTLKNLQERISSMEKRNILIILDECHFANSKDHTLGKFFSNLSLNDPLYLTLRNIKILQISATPSNTLIDAETWTSFQGKVSPKIKRGYVSFQSLLSENRIRDVKSLNDKDQCSDYISEVTKDRKKMYHLVRSVCNGPTGSETYQSISDNLEELCISNKFVFYELNMEKTHKEIKQFYESLSREPVQTTFVLIKNMLGASKTLDDTYIGSVHESNPIKKGYSSEIQGLPGRLCGWTKKTGIDGVKIYCSKEIVEQYIHLYESNFNYQVEDLLWSDSRLKILLNGSIRTKDSYLMKEEEEITSS
jgi:hypothetical protein